MKKQTDVAAELVMQGAREYLTKPLVAKRFVPWLDKRYVRILSDTTEELEVGAVVLAGGFECYDPKSDPQGAADIWNIEHPGVLTAVEFERLISGTGPTGGKLLMPGTDKPVEKIAWIQCVGSRDVQKNADFCTGICCMFSIKEALLAKRVTDGAVDTSIFYMDMRTSGKGYQRYRINAEKEEGVRFVRSRPHTVLPTNDGKLKLEYLTDEGTLIAETFDMVVLAAGARPPKGTDKFAQTIGVDLNQWGFVDTKPYSPERTSQVGVFAAGALGEPKDISESVIQAGAAAQAASRIIKAYDVLAGIATEPEVEYPDVSREPPRTLVAICSSCPTLAQAVDIEALGARMAMVHSVCRVVNVGSACTTEGWGDIEKAAVEFKPNRILIGACMPYAYIPRLKELGRTIGLNPALMDVVDIYTPTFATDDKDAVEKEIYASLSTAVARLQGVDPVPPSTMVDVARSALVVGGGLAGMTASMAIADQGYGVCMVEAEEELGGMAMRLHTQLDGSDPRKYMEELIAQVEKHPNIKVFKDSRVVLSRGSAGRFRSAIASPEGVFPLEHGVSILATGAQEAKVYESGLCVHKSVMTHLALEEQLATGQLDAGALSAVAMIQCWRAPGEDRTYCSRVCCPEMVKNVLALKERNPDLPVYVFYRDIMMPGFLETYYTQARKAGAIFIRYERKRRPRSCSRTASRSSLPMTTYSGRTFASKRTSFRSPAEWNPMMWMISLRFSVWNSMRTVSIRKRTSSGGPWISSSRESTHAAPASLPEEWARPWPRQRRLPSGRCGFSMPRRSHAKPWWLLSGIPCVPCVRHASRHVRTERGWWIWNSDRSRWTRSCVRAAAPARRSARTVRRCSRDSTMAP